MAQKRSEDEPSTFREVKQSKTTRVQLSLVLLCLCAALNYRKTFSLRGKIFYAENSWSSVSMDFSAIEFQTYTKNHTIQR